MVLNRRLSEEIRLQNIHFSYGVFLIHDYRLQIERMNVYAVMAKDTVKNTPEKMIGYFNNKIREDLLDEQEIEEMMGPALVNKEFKVFLQPKYSSDGKHVHGAEALVRWFSPSKGVVSPSAFIPTFERNYFIIRLDNYMLEEVCYLQRKWLDMGKTPVVISVNISRVHLTDENLIGDILHIVDKYMVPHKYIELELTESAFFDNKDVLVSTVKRLRAEGFVVSMDDFGSGYSSLNSLKDISLDVIKLDREFFDAMEDNSRSRIVIENTISMAKNLNLKIVAEGIETKEQVQFLHEIGCDLIQGFYFSKPMSVSDFEELMHYQ